MLYKPRYIKFSGITIGRNKEYLLSSIQGIGNGSVTSQNTDYIDTDGGERSQVFYEMRHFSVVGYILADAPDMAEKRRRKLAKACSPKRPFEIVYFNGINKFGAECYTDELPTFEKINSRNYKFVVNFTVPGFYWNDVALIHRNVAAREDMIINGRFVLPMVFTKMYNSAEIKNNGDAETFPIITVSAAELTDEDALIVVNETTGKTIGVNYQLAKGEEITFDHNEGTISSNINGNIYNKITAISEFWGLQIGNNTVSCPNCNVVISIKYKNKYEGV